MDPPSPQDLINFIFEKWEILFSRSWVNSFATSQIGFFIVDALSMENKRIDVNLKELEENADSFKRKLENTDPRLICNIDECG